MASAYPAIFSATTIADLRITFAGLRVEVLNGSASLEANRTALRYCKELGLQPIGACDAHVTEQIGKYVTYLPEKVEMLRDFIDELRIRPTLPAIYGTGYNMVDTF